MWIIEDTLRRKLKMDWIIEDMFVKVMKEDA